MPPPEVKGRLSSYTQRGTAVTALKHRTSQVQAVGGSDRVNHEPTF